MKYHAGKYKMPLCGSRGIDGFKTVALPPKEWDSLKPEYRCLKCIKVIQDKKSGVQTLY